MKTDYDSIARRAKAGDESAYAELYDICRAYAAKIAYKLLWDRPNDQEDAVQEIVVRSFLKINMWQERSRFITWFHRIAMNVCFMARRTAKTRALDLSVSMEYETEDGEVLAFDIGYDDPGYARVEAVMVVRYIMPRLSPKLRENLEGRYFDGLSKKEQSEKVGISVPAVKSRAMRAMRTAREIMSELDNGVRTIETKPRCTPCETSTPSRYRFADGDVDGVPMCKWCMTAAKVEAPMNGSPSAPRASKSKMCICGCGKSYIPTSNVQKYMPGHKPEPQTSIATRPAKIRQTPAPTLVQPLPNGNPNQLVTVRIPVSVIDEMYAAANPAMKAKAFEAMFGDD